MEQITRILNQLDSGDSNEADQLLPLLYDQLRQLAAVKLKHERPDHTLQATALVHEAWLRVVGDDDKDKHKWNSRGHFFGAAAEAMRRILIDHARKRAAQKRGGDAVRITFSDIEVAAEDASVDLLALDAALAALDDAHPRLGKLVRLRYFAGASIQQTAELLEISPATAKRDWVYARAWLYERMSAA